MEPYTSANPTFRVNDITPHPRLKRPNNVPTSELIDHPKLSARPSLLVESLTFAMGFWDTITDLVEAATPWGVADAEAPEEPKVRFRIVHGTASTFNGLFFCVLQSSMAA